MPTVVPGQAEPCLRLQLIGPMKVTDAGGRDLLPRTRKSRALLAVLALATPDPVSRARLTELLWSQRGREQARGSLRQCVHELQSILQPVATGLFEAERDQLRLSAALIWTDVKSGDGADGRALLEDLTGLDPAFDDWIGRERERRLRLREASSPHRPVRLGIRPLRLLGVWDEGGFAAGLEEELIAALTKFRWLSCVPVSGSEGEEGACLEYLLCGSVRRSGAHIRIGLRLLDARGGGEVVWTRSFDGMTEDALSLQGRIAAEAAAQIDPELLTREGGRAAARLNDRPSGMELALAALPGMFRLERDQFERSGQLLSEAAARAPDLASVHAWLAYWNIVAVGQGWRTDRQAKEAMQRAGALAERAVVLDPLDARAITIAGHVRAFLDRRVEEGLALHERALALNPALPMAWMWSGLAHAYRGDHHRAIEDIERARSLSPFDPHAFFFEVALMLPHLMLGDYRRAAELGRVTAQVKPGFSSSWKALLAAVGHLGRPAEAAEIRTRLLQLEPGFCVSQAMQRSPFVRPEDRARFAEGLRLGGLPA